jgi:signal transduction histidine kinase
LVDQENLDSETEYIAIHLGSQIENAVNDRIDLIDIFVNEWIDTINESHLFDQSRYLNRVPYYFTHYPGYLGINWINPTGVIEWVYPIANNSAALGRNITFLLSGDLNYAFYEAQVLNQTGITNVTALFQGGVGMVTYHPLIYYNQSSQQNITVGFFNVVFQINPFIDQIIQDFPEVNLFSFELTEFGKKIYHFQENITIQDKIISEYQINIRGREWNLVVAPTSELKNENSLMANSMIFFIGLFAAVITFLLSASLLNKIEIIEKAYHENELIERKLFESQKMEALGTLAGGVAHDYNNILMGIQGYAGMIQDQVESISSSCSPEQLSEIKDDFASIFGLISRAKDLSGQILSFSRHSDLNFTVVDINDVIKSTVNIFSETVDRRIKIELKTWHTPLLMYGNLSRLNSSLMNLLVNARDALILEGKIDVIIELLNEAFPDFAFPQIPELEFDLSKTIQIKIMDNGIGIKAENLKKIFDPFFTTKPIGHGTGLGLFIVYKTVKDMFGDIDVSSISGRGTTFTIHFPPLKKSITFQNHSETTLGLDLIEFKEILTGKQILIVEDEGSIRKTITNYAKKIGISMVMEDNGLNAIELIRKVPSQFSLFIIDINMPKMNGLDLFEQIRQYIPNPKVIFITGYSEEKLPPIIPLFIDKLQKPFSINELFQKILTMIKN